MKEFEQDLVQATKDPTKNLLKFLDKYSEHRPGPGGGLVMQSPYATLDHLSSEAQKQYFQKVKDVVNKILKNVDYAHIILGSSDKYRDLVDFVDMVTPVLKKLGDFLTKQELNESLDSLLKAFAPDNTEQIVNSLSSQFSEGELYLLKRYFELDGGVSKFIDDHLGKLRS